MEKKTFYQYMMTYLTWNTPRGDLARDMARELYLHPEENVDKIDSEEWFMHYLNAHRACQECINVAHRCWRTYFDGFFILSITDLKCTPCQGQMNLTGSKTDPEDGKL